MGLQTGSVVPADGFVEWRKTEQGKEPLWFRRADRPGALLWFAGLVLPDGFVIVTTPPSADVQAVDDRMPAILPPGRVGAWLDDEWLSAQRLLNGRTAQDEGWLRGVFRLRLWCTQRTRLGTGGQLKA